MLYKFENERPTIIQMSNTREIKAENLRRLREERKWKQPRMADLLEDSVGNISGMERLHRPISDDTIDELCDKLKVRPYQFFIESNTPILADDSEIQLIETFRELRRVGTAKEIATFGDLFEAYLKTVGGSRDVREGRALKATQHVTQERRRKKKAS